MRVKYEIKEILAEWVEFIQGNGNTTPKIPICRDR